MYCCSSALIYIRGHFSFFDLGFVSKIIRNGNLFMDPEGGTAPATIAKLAYKVLESERSAYGKGCNPENIAFTGRYGMH
jgi:hypothetical protein